MANTIETTELQNLPIVTRNISGMLQLLPGATPVQAIHRTKENAGTVSFGGSMGGNVANTVDAHHEGRNDKRQMNINPILNGQRRLAPEFQRGFGDRGLLSNVFILSGINKTRYDALTFLFQRRLPRVTLQAHYTLAGSFLGLSPTTTKRPRVDSRLLTKRTLPERLRRRSAGAT